MINFSSFTQRLFPSFVEYKNKITYGEQYPQAPISPVIPSVIPQGNAIILFFEL